MEISSYTSNIQPYGLQNGTNVAYGKSGALPSMSGPKENSSPETVKNDDPNFSIEAAVKMSQERQQLNREERVKMVEKMNEFISSINKGVSFKVDEESGKDVVTIYEARTGNIIRQIPDEEMLEIFRRLVSQATRSGLLVDKV
ncbi:MULTISPECIES: flagellar protein FlaG [Vibrio]|uniref:flagellar protein FlaG n=1 Tax=Vibrio TaxID=662 RepID=UPI0005F0967D|nr:MULTISPECIES: flagellar protein FlaG [Vibrio]KJR29452.1 flagellar protein FlaG [Vibrio sp. S234-5]MBE4604825.1 flagellar biosynthesis protein FlaG [Vibrio navarrensis]